MTPLVIGIILIVGGIAFAVAPLLRRRSGEAGSSGDEASAGVAPAAQRAPQARGDAAGAAVNGGVLPPTVASALEELELDRAMGKLGERDYDQLRASVLRDARAAATPLTAPASPPLSASVDEDAASTPDAMVVAAPGRSVDLADEAERMVRALRATVVRCPDCGPRPEPEAPFCSNCGRALDGCPTCGASIAHPGARFCDRCGTALTS